MARLSRVELPSAATTTGARKSPAVRGRARPTIRSVRESMIGAVTLRLLVQLGARRRPRCGPAGRRSRSAGGPARTAGSRPDRARPARTAARRRRSAALVVQPAGLLAGVDAEPDQLPGGPRGEPVAADLLPRELRLLQQRDVAGRAGPGGSRSPNRPDRRRRRSRRPRSTSTQAPDRALVKSFTNSRAQSLRLLFRPATPADARSSREISQPHKGKPTRFTRRRRCVNVPAADRGRNSRAAGPLRSTAARRAPRKPPTPPVSAPGQPSKRSTSSGRACSSLWWMVTPAGTRRARAAASTDRSVPLGPETTDSDGSRPPGTSAERAFGRHHHRLDRGGPTQSVDPQLLGGVDVEQARGRQRASAAAGGSQRRRPAARGGVRARRVGPASRISCAAPRRSRAPAAAAAPGPSRRSRPRP